MGNKTGINHQLNVQHLKLKLYQMHRIHFLHNIFKPEKFNKKDLEFVLDQFEKVEIKKNDFLIEKGKTANHYFFIESGFFRSYSVNLKGNSITTKFFIERDIVIDWYSYILNKSCLEPVQALTNATCWKISYENSIKLFEIEAFREINRLLLLDNYFELKNHLVSVTSCTAKERYLNFIKENPKLVKYVPFKHIATYLGITDTSLSRIRKDITL